HHNDRTRRVEPCRQERREPNGTGADDGNAVTRLRVAVEDTALEAGRQDVAQHREGLVLDVRRSVVEARLRERNAHVPGLGAVEGVPEDPPAVFAMGVHPAPAWRAYPIGGDAGDQHPLAGMEVLDRSAGL